MLRSISWRTALCLLIPSIVFVAIRARTLDYEFVWTDRGEIVEGLALLPPDELHRAFGRSMLASAESDRYLPYYRPLQVVSASVIHAAVGKQPRYFRAFGIGLGAISLLLFNLLVWRWTQHNLGATLFAGLVPALHPAGIGVFAWIAALSEPLANLFVIAALLFASLAVAGRGPAYGLAAVSFLCGLLSKESAAIFPALFASLWLSQRPFADWRKIPLAPLAFAALTAALAGLYLFVWRPFVLGGTGVGASPIGKSLLSHAASSLAVWPDLFTYLLFPWHSTNSDVVRVVSSPFDVWTGLGVLLAIGIFASCGWLLRAGLGLAAFGLAWVALAYLPTSGLLPLLHARADRYVYFSSFGLALALVGLLPALSRPLRNRAFQFALAASAVLYLSFLAERSWARTPDWRSNLSLFQADVSADPRYREGRYWLALSLTEAGRHAEASVHLETLLEQIPSPPDLRSYLKADVRALYCQVQLRAGRPYAAESFLRELFAREAERAKEVALRACLADALEGSGRWRQALTVYQSLVEESSSPAPALIMAVARNHARLGQEQAAQNWLTRVSPEARRDPDVHRQWLATRALLSRAKRSTP